MKITQLYGIESAASARGTVVVIDVLRAFTTAAYAFHSGIEEIFLVGDPEHAFLLKKTDPALILVGEMGGIKIPGFDYGNSPAVMKALDLRGKRMVLRSSSGTQGVVHAKGADEILLGSLVVGAATAKYLATKGDSTLLAMGSPEGPDRDEDIACSDYIAGLIQGKNLRSEAVRRVLATEGAVLARDPKVDWISEEDLECAIQVDAFNFVMRVEKRKGVQVARSVLGASGLRPGG